MPDISSILANNQFNTSIWGDEGFSAILSMKSPVEIIKILINDTSPPLWNLTEHLVFRIFGPSELAIRGLAFLYFALTVFFVFKIGKLLWGKRTGMLAAALIFFNPFFFIYAFEGRMYSIMALGVTASMYFFLKRNWVGYVIATVWALYSHHFAIFNLFIQGLWFLYYLVRGKKVRAKRIFKSFIAIGLLYLPWAWPLYNQTKMVGGGFWLATPTVEDFATIISDYLAMGIKNPLVKIPMTEITLNQVGLVLVAITLVLRKWHKKIEKSVFFLLWFLGPIAMTWLISQKFQSIFFNRYLLYTIPAAMLLVASQRRKWSAIPIGLLLTVFIFIDFNYFTTPIKLPFREMSLYVQETREEGDYLINWNSNGAHHIWETKFYGIGAPIYVPEGDLPFFVGTALMEENDIIRTIPEGAKRVGVVTSGPIEQVELENYTLESQKEMQGLKFIWLEKSTTEGSTQDQTEK